MNKRDIDYMSNNDKKETWDEHNDQWREDASMPSHRYRNGRVHMGPQTIRPWWFKLIETLIALGLFAAFIYFVAM